MAQNLREADFAQLKAKVEADLATLESQRPKRGLEAEQHALDMKYLRDRQMYFGLRINVPILFGAVGPLGSFHF